MSRILLGVITIWFSKMLDLKKLENIGMTNIARICIKIREKNDRSFLKFLLFCFTYLCSSKQGESALIEARKIHDKYVLLNVLCPDVLVLTAKEFQKKNHFVLCHIFVHTLAGYSSYQKTEISTDLGTLILSK